MAQELDQDRVRAAGVAAPVSSKQDYLDRAADPRKNFLRTADADDHLSGWTAAKGAAADPQELPGQVFAPSQLPDPAAAVAAGFPPVQIPPHLILESDDELHPQGPEPSERAIIQERNSLRQRLVDLSEENKAEAEATEDEDANPSQGGSQIPAGGSPGEAEQDPTTGGGQAGSPEVPADTAAATTDQPAEESSEEETSSSSSSRRGRGSRSRS